MKVRQAKDIAFKCADDTGELSSKGAIKAMKEYASLHISAVLDAISKKVRIRVTPHDQEEYLITSAKSSYLNKEHADGFEIEIDMESIAKAYSMKNIK